MYSMTVIIMLMTTSGGMPVKELTKPEPFATEAECKAYPGTLEGVALMKHILVMARQEFSGGGEIRIGLSCDKAGEQDHKDSHQDDCWKTIKPYAVTMIPRRRA